MVFPNKDKQHGPWKWGGILSLLNILLIGYLVLFRDLVIDDFIGYLAFFLISASFGWSASAFLFYRRMSQLQSGVDGGSASSKTSNQPLQQTRSAGS